jgi:hypothetical protein
MSDDRKRGADERPANEPEDVASEKQREALGRFAKYTSPAMLAVLLGKPAYATLY